MNNNNHWKTTVDEFRGFVKGKLEGLESIIVSNSRHLEEINKYIIQEKAKRKIMSSIYGFIGGTLISGLFLLIRYLLGR